MKKLIFILVGIFVLGCSAEETKEENLSFAEFQSKVLDSTNTLLYKGTAGLTDDHFRFFDQLKAAHDNLDQTHIDMFAGFHDKHIKPLGLSWTTAIYHGTRSNDSHPCYGC